MTTELARYLETGLRNTSPIKHANFELAQQVNQAGLGYFDGTTPLTDIAKLVRNPGFDLFSLSPNAQLNDLIRWSRFTEDLKTKSLNKYQALNRAFTQLLSIKDERDRTLFSHLELLREMELTEMEKRGLTRKLSRFFKHATNQNLRR